jgi:hypothetical protein
MKTLQAIKKNQAVKAQTKAQIKTQLKREFSKGFNRPNKLVEAYFDGNFDQKLFDRLKGQKTNGIENLLYCFEPSDSNRLTGFLIKVFDLPYFSKSLKGLTPELFMEILFDLCTIKDGAKRKINFVRQNKDVACNYQEFTFEYDFSRSKPINFQVEVIFEIGIIEMLFQAYYM